MQGHRQYPHGQRKRRRTSSVLLCFCSLALTSTNTGSSFVCPNKCSNNGACSSTYGTCTCYTGFTGADCSLRSCATGTAWIDTPNATDSAHLDEVECSYAGVCDRATGVCQCQTPFEGTACQKMACPSPGGEVCSGRGTCTSMQDFAEAFDGVVRLQKTEYTLWDAEKVYGCVCDPPYFGYDCSLKACSSGDDPASILTDQECNGRGTCDYDTGLCSCEDGYSSSETEDDCSVIDAGTVETCPISPASHSRGFGGIDLSGQCSQRGFCDESDSDKSKYCQCHDGWTGYNCDLRTCPTGRAWFDEATDADVAHAVTECSAMGHCNRLTGRCSCRKGFVGAACDKLQCPKDEHGNICGGTGRCLTMREIAANAVDEEGSADPQTYGSIPDPYSTSTWDADKIQGCQCDGSVRA